MANDLHKIIELHNAIEQKTQSFVRLEKDYSSLEQDFEVLKVKAASDAKFRQQVEKRQVQTYSRAAVGDDQHPSTGRKPKIQTYKHERERGFGGNAAFVYRWAPHTCSRDADIFQWCSYDLSSSSHLH